MKKEFWKLLKVLSVIIIFSSLALFLSLQADNTTNIVSNKKVNFSSSDYKNLDFSRDNITYKTIDNDGNIISGEEFFGINGKYYKIKPYIFGENEYSYWFYNESYIVKPEKLIPDLFHEKQSITSSAYKIESINNSVNIFGYSHETDKLLLEGYEGYFETRFTVHIHGSTSYDTIPLGAVLIIDYDKESSLHCSSTEIPVPLSYVSYDLEYRHRASAFLLEKIEKKFTIDINCKIESQQIPDNKNVSFSIYQNIFYLNDENELREGIEDEHWNLIGKKIFYKELIINEE